jgi:hypothetical protein
MARPNFFDLEKVDLRQWTICCRHQQICDRASRGDALETMNKVRRLLSRLRLSYAFTVPASF